MFYRAGVVDEAEIFSFGEKLEFTCTTYVMNKTVTCCNLFEHAGSEIANISILPLYSGW